MPPKWLRRAWFSDFLLAENSTPLNEKSDIELHLGTLGVYARELSWDRSSAKANRLLINHEVRRGFGELVSRLRSNRYPKFKRVIALAPSKQIALQLAKLGFAQAEPSSTERLRMCLASFMAPPDIWAAKALTRPFDRFRLVRFRLHAIEMTALTAPPSVSRDAPP